MTPVNDYKIWLEKVSKRFDVSEEHITGGRKYWWATDAKQVFFTLCYRDGICLYQLSRTLGKHRCTIHKSFKKVKFKDKKIVDEIWSTGKTTSSSKQ